ncbi:glycosyltransferase family 2 protein [Chroococcus sp. FPU101]|uniref:glycosyltransferase family 2 protein n=1 Tax=Chroococcus sp. FPU101 TaxID=1974212 RepID=UPI001A8FEBDB|nr:glycosyltransferase family 2 protein [Chroococcus sp. FPU101]GFE68470.1 glycosyl transferase family 2 [Chroococcus sp. FPU101]
MSIPKIAGIICTYNRDYFLGGAIDSLLAQDCQDIELVVVDNGSSDRTSEVVEKRLSDPRLKYVYEPVVGLSVARNTGAAKSQAPILAYLDDDAVASPQWLRLLLEAYTTNEKLGVAGGKVTLIWPNGQTPPKWMSDSLAGGLGAFDLGDQPLLIEQPNLTPRGVNYSLRRAFLEQVGGFDPNLGRIGKRLLSNEELYMTELALNNGWQVAYLPDALVEHNVSPERINPNWFLQRGWWQGVSEHYREEIAGRTGLRQITRGSERLVRGLYKATKYINNPSLRFDNLVYAYGQIGYLSEAVKGMVSKEKPE